MTKLPYINTSDKPDILVNRRKIRLKKRKSDKKKKNLRPLTGISSHFFAFSDG